MRACVVTTATPRSKSRRRKLVASAKRRLGRWSNGLDAQVNYEVTDNSLAVDLCRAIADLQTALYLQTGGVAGTLHASANDVVRVQKTLAVAERVANEAAAAAREG